MTFLIAQAAVTVSAVPQTLAEFKVAAMSLIGAALIGLCLALIALFRAWAEAEAERQDAARARAAADTAEANERAARARAALERALKVAVIKGVESIPDPVTRGRAKSAVTKMADALHHEDELNDTLVEMKLSKGKKK